MTFVNKGKFLLLNLVLNLYSWKYFQIFIDDGPNMLHAAYRHQEDEKKSTCKELSNIYNKTDKRTKVWDFPTIS